MSEIGIAKDTGKIMMVLNFDHPDAIPVLQVTISGVTKKYDFKGLIQRLIESGYLVEFEG